MIYFWGLCLLALVACSHSASEVVSMQNWGVLHCVKKTEKSLDPLPWQVRHCVGKDKRKAIAKTESDLRARAETCEEKK